MIRYSTYQPTGFDSKGLALPDRQDWFVAPCSRTRDSDVLQESNFHAQLRELGGESETVEVHRFGHWGPGWYEIVLIHPDREADGEEIESGLENSVVLDEGDLSNREHEEYLENWDSWLCRDFQRMVVKAFGLADETEYRITDIDNDKWRELYESLIPSGDYYRDNHMGTRLDGAVDRLERGELARWIRLHRVIRVTA